MRAEGPRPEPDIEWPGLAADSDGRRDIANAILADQSGADHDEAAQGHQPTWLLPRAVRERMGTLLRCGRHTVTTKQCRIHRQPLSRHSFAGCDAVTAGGRQGITRQQFLALCRGGRTKVRDRVEDRRLAARVDIRPRPWVFRPRTGLLPMGFCCATLPVVTCALLQPTDQKVAAFKGFCRF